MIDFGQKDNYSFKREKDRQKDRQNYRQKDIKKRQIERNYEISFKKL